MGGCTSPIRCYRGVGRAVADGINGDKKEMQRAEEKRVQVEAQVLQCLEISKKEQDEKRMHTEMQLLQTISETTRILEEKRMQTELHMLQKN